MDAIVGCITLLCTVSSEDLEVLVTLVPEGTLYSDGAALDSSLFGFRAGRLLLVAGYTLFFRSDLSCIFEGYCRFDS